MPGHPRFCCTSIGVQFDFQSQKRLHLFLVFHTAHKCDQYSSSTLLTARGKPIRKNCNNRAQRERMQGSTSRTCAAAAHHDESDEEGCCCQRRSPSVLNSVQSHGTVPENLEMRCSSSRRRRRRNSTESPTHSNFEQHSAELTLCFHSGFLCVLLQNLHRLHCGMAVFILLNCFLVVNSKQPHSDAIANKRCISDESSRSECQLFHERAGDACVAIASHLVCS